MKKEKTKIRKILDVVFTIIVSITTLFAGISAYQKFSGNTILPFGVYWVLTDSMDPTIEESSYILVDYTKTDDVKVNDIITFAYKDFDGDGEIDFNTHRVIAINGETLITQGDKINSNNPYLNVNLKDSSSECNEINDGYINGGKLYVIEDSSHNFVNKGQVEVVKLEEVEAIYVANLNLLTAFGRFFMTPYGLIAVFIVFTMLFMAWNSINKKQYNEKNKEKLIQDAIKKEVARLEQESKK